MAMFTPAWTVACRVENCHVDTVTVTGTENLMTSPRWRKAPPVWKTRLANRKWWIWPISSTLRCKSSGAGTDTITIEGVGKPRRCHHQVVADRPGSTYLIAITGAIYQRIRCSGFWTRCYKKLKEAGATITTGDDWIELDMEGRRPKAVSPAPHVPGDALSTCRPSSWP